MKYPYKAGTTVRITSPYGWRKDPFGGSSTEWHTGIDFVGSDKTICAVSDGVVAWAGQVLKSAGGLTWQWGNYVRIETADGTREYYCHMDTILVYAGKKVKAGDPVGIEGSTGNVTGRHLHFEVRNKAGTKLNTATYLGISNAVGTYSVQKDTADKYPDSYERNGLTFVRAKNFAVKYHDASKRTGNYSRYVNGGFFATYKTKEGVYFTLPVGNVVCDMGTIPFTAREYIGRYVSGGKLRYSCDDNQSKQFHGMRVSTLIVPAKGDPYITDINEIPADAIYAISGVPTVRNGDDVDYYNYVQKQGWDTSCMYATYRSWLGIRDGGIWLITGRTYTKNYIYGMEFWKKVRDEQFDDIICIDGGGSYYWKNGKTVKTTAGSRQINTVITI
jgi:hypothetical protein